MITTALLRLLAAGYPVTARRTVVLVISALNVGVAGGQTSASAALGAVIPIGGTADVLNAGYHATLALALKPINPRNRIRLEGTVWETPDKQSVGETHRFVSATANLLMSGTNGPGPSGYLIAGAGSYQHDGGGQRSTNFGANIGVGIHFPLGSFGTLLESRVHYVADPARTKLVPFTFGLTF